jgi:hypothetical protein
MKFNHFSLANHMFVLGSLGYVVCDFIRAVFDRPNQAGYNNRLYLAIDICYFLLSCWFVFDSFIYLKAFLLSVRTDLKIAMANTPANKIVQSRSAAIQTTQAGIVHAKPDSGLFTLWYESLFTAIGLAYTANVLASIGYMITSALPFVQTETSTLVAKDLDRGALYANVINMLIFSLSAICFSILYLRDMRNHKPAHLNISARAGDSADKFCSSKMGYGIAHMANIAASAGYLAFNSWCLHERYLLEGEFDNNPQYYYSQSSEISWKLRFMFLAGDIMYLACAVALELAWFVEDKSPVINDLYQNTVLKLPEVVLNAHIEQMKLNLENPSSDYEKFDTDNEIVDKTALIKAKHNFNIESTKLNSDVELSSLNYSNYNNDRNSFSSARRIIDDRSAPLDKEIAPSVRFLNSSELR